MAAFGLIKRFLGGNGAAERRGLPRSPVLKGATVLVVDDSATIRAVLGKMLSQDGYVVLKAADGEEALQVARNEKPDLIFLDIVLPGMNGFSVLRALRRDQRTHEIPIVMISGNLQATEQFYVQRFGADDFMKKPFGRAEVFERIRHLLESGRLVLRPAAPEVDEPLSLAATPVEADDQDAIPDIAMPDERDMSPAAEARAAELAAARALPPPPPLPPRYPEQQAPAGAALPVQKWAADVSAPDEASEPTPPPLPSAPRHWSDI